MTKRDAAPVLVLWCSCGAEQVAEPVVAETVGRNANMERHCRECGRIWKLTGRLEEVRGRHPSGYKWRDGETSIIQQ